jgi:hypothetical protein
MKRKFADEPEENFEKQIKSSALYYHYQEPVVENEVFHDLKASKYEVIL